MILKASNTRRRIFLALARLIGRQHWIRSGIRYRVFAGVRGDVDFEVDFQGYRYRGNLKNYVDRYVFFFGGYEYQHLQFLRNFLTPESVVLDIGANIGQHSLYFSRRAAQVHAFDPHLPSLDRLHSHIAHNRIANISVHPVALGGQDESKDFFAPHNDDGSVGSFLPEHHSSSNRNVGATSIYNGDKYLTAHGITGVGLIKIEVEGYEQEALRGLQRTIARNRPVIFMEFLPITREKFGSIHEFMEAFPSGYQAYALSTDRPVGVIFNSAACRLVPFDFDATSGNIILLPPSSANGA